jgi:unsaturated chondroitin disaccharide hydrolase
MCTCGAGAWTCGFYPALLWKLYNYTNAVGDASAGWWKSQAQARTAPIAPEQYDNTTHDVGFMVYYTFGQQWLLTGDPTAHAVTLQTAHTLAERYSPIVGCVESWGDIVPDPTPDTLFEVIIDNMMNLELLWWASVDSGNTTLLAMARNHTDHMMRDMIRADGCSWHLVVYSPINGSVLSQSSQPQGYNQTSIWARGQARGLVC